MSSHAEARARIEVAADIAEADAVAAAKDDGAVRAAIGDKTVVKAVWVPGKLVNFAVK